jgi:hypothetical protein
MDVWECDFLDVQALSKTNDKYKHLLTVTDVFSKLLHIVLLKSKTCPGVSSAFQSIFKTQNILGDVQSGCELIRVKNF